MQLTDSKITAATLALSIRQHVAQVAQVEPNTVQIDVESIETVINSAYCAGSKNRIQAFNKAGSLATLTLPQAAKYFPELFDPILVNPQAIFDICAKRAEKQDSEGEKKPRGRPRKNAGMDEINEALYVYPWQHLIDYVVMEKQASQMAMLIDPFVSKPSLQVIGEEVLVTYRAQPPEIVGKQDDDVAADFLDHFPYLDDLLDWIMAARFCKDRKQCYLWLHCPSDWGKSLLLSILTEAGAALALNVAEARKAFNGDPLALSPAHFRTPILMVFDEFDRVTSEMKLLQNEMYISPKFGMRCSVELFGKLFMSKECVSSMGTEQGIEEQMANRMCYLAGQGTLNARPIFMAKGKPAYYRGLSHYVTNRLRESFEGYVEMGKELAQETAQAVVERFYSRHAIGQQFGRFSEQLDEHASDWGEWIYTTFERPTIYNAKAASLVRDNLIWDEAKQQYFLKRPFTVFDAYLNTAFAQSHRVAIKRAYDEIAKTMSADSAGVKSHRIGRHGVVQSIALRPHYNGFTPLKLEGSAGDNFGGNS